MTLPVKQTEAAYTVDLIEYRTTWERILTHLNGLSDSFQEHSPAVKERRLRKDHNEKRKSFNSYVREVESQRQRYVDYNGGYDEWDRPVWHQGWPTYCTHWEERDYYINPTHRPCMDMLSKVQKIIATTESLPGGTVTITPDMAKEYSDACNGRLINRANQWLADYIAEAKAPLEELVPLYQPRLRIKHRPPEPGPIVPILEPKKSDKGESSLFWYIGIVISVAIGWCIWL